MPTMSIPAEETLPSAHLDDDIPEPVLPIEVAEAITPALAPEATPVIQTLDVLQAMNALNESAKKHLATMAEEGKTVLRSIDSTWQVISRLCDAVHHDGGPLLPHFIGVLEEVCTKGLRLESHGAPYTMALETQSPQGFAVTFTIRKATADALLDEVGRMLPWLAQAGYQPCTGA